MLIKSLNKLKDGMFCTPGNVLNDDSIMPSLKMIYYYLNKHEMIRYGMMAVYSLVF